MDADHIATVSTLILRKSPLRSTLLLALRWSLGHSLTLLLLAGLMVLGAGFEAGRLTWIEQGVGLSMIVLAIWILRKGKVESRQPLHASDTKDSHSAWALFGMGLLHGGAGWSAMLLMIPLAWGGSPTGVLAYAATFSFGMMVTMIGYAALVNRLTGWGEISHHVVKLRYLSAVITAGIGLRLLVS